MRADKKVLDRYESVDPGIVTLNQLTVARRAYETDLNNVAKAERTLRSWGVSENEIKVVRNEAKRLGDPKASRDEKLERSWAEVEIRAPFAGVIVEKNITYGDVVDPTLDLFKIADLTRMRALVNVPEEDLPRLQGLPKDERVWKATLSTDPDGKPHKGSFDNIGAIIDPTQHTGTVSGWVENKDGKLFVGQFLSVTVQLPPDRSLVEVPAEAVVEEESGPHVYVETSAGDNVFERRRVSVAGRGSGKAYLRLVPLPADARAGAVGMKGDEVVVARGAVELAGEWKQQQNSVKGPDELKKNQNSVKGPE
jgi:cobalt-zinc-cadmium efflux system membrane fusion protein